MADFCKQCSIELFGKDYKDLKGFCTKKQNKAGKYPVVLCEGCGGIQVDYDGKCVSEDCIKGHGKTKLKEIQE
jgi:hypothetical protein